MAHTDKSRVCIVGGGPAGALVAYGLAEKGYDVTLFERYPHPSTATKKGSKAYSIVINPRGQFALDAFGLGDDLPGTVKSDFLSRGGAGKAKLIPAKQLVVLRNTLSSSLLNKAAEAGAKLKFEHRLKDILLDSKVAVFETFEKKTVEFQYDVLVGCDGVHSRTRKILSENVKDFEGREEEDTMEYQVAVLPRRLDHYLKDSSEASLPDTAIHSWNNRAANSLCLAFPTEEGGLLFTVIFPGGELGAFAKKEAFESPIKTLLPSLTDEAYQEIIKQLEDSTPATGGTCVWVNRLTEGSVALVGDSAHGMWPSLGQGANCALESAALFVKAACERTETWLADYESRRYEDVVRAVDLTFSGFGGKSSRHMKNAPKLFLAQLALMMLLNKVTLGVVPKPALMRVFMGENVGYAKLYRWNAFYERYILYGTLATAVASLAGWAFWRHQQ